MSNNCFYAFNYIDGKIVVVGKAEMTLAHGNPMWFCSTMPPLKQYSEVVELDNDVKDFFYRNCGPKEEIVVIKGVVDN